MPASSGGRSLTHRPSRWSSAPVSARWRHLAETGALYERDGRWVSDRQPEDAGIPEGIREVVGRRLSRLGDDVEAVLRAAAVIGYEFDVDLIADVVGRDVDHVLDALDVAMAANLVLEVGVDRHRFAHALVRETLHGELSSSRRARQHRKVAEAIEARHAGDLDVVVAELATHWTEASAGGDPSRAIELTVRAGELAVERGGTRRFPVVRRRLDLLDDDVAADAERRRILVRLARVPRRSPDRWRKGTPTPPPRGRRGDRSRRHGHGACAALAISARATRGANLPTRNGSSWTAALAMDGHAPQQRATLLGELSGGRAHLRPRHAGPAGHARGVRPDRRPRCADAGGS